MSGEVGHARTGTPQVSVIVVVYNGREYLGQCLRSVLAQDYPEFEVLVVDNGSTDGSGELVQLEFPQVTLLSAGRNLGFAGGNNVGIRHARGDILFLVNVDVVLDRRCMTALVRALTREPQAGIAGCKVYDPDWKTLQHAGALLKPNGLTDHIGRGELDTGQYDRVSEPDYVTGAAIAIRREVIQACGLLDHAYFPIYFEETDLCITARSMGYRVIFVPEARLMHHESVASGKLSQPFLTKYHRNRLRFVLKTFPGSRIIRDFVPYEMYWLLRWKPREHLGPLANAYIRALLSMPEILGHRVRRKMRRWAT